jgi:DDE superfamily endonuclease
MEDVLDVYHQPYDESRPLVCLDESSKQLIGETREPIPPAPAQPGSSDQPGKPGHPERYDFEYVRNGTANLFMVTQPLLGWRHVEVTDRRTAKDFAEILRWLAEDVHPEAKKIVLVMDNLNTHKLASLYEAFEPSRARALAERFEIHHTPKHGSWLNMAEIEFSVLNRQCLDRRIATKDELMKEIAAWEDDRNDRQIGIRWRFTTADARIKLHRLYPASE